MLTVARFGVRVFARRRWIGARALFFAAAAKNHATAAPLALSRN